MRPGLVVVGVVLLVLAAGTALIVLLPSPPGDARQSSIALSPTFLALNQSNSEVIDFGSNPSGQLSLGWSGTSKFRVVLFEASDCWPGEGNCPAKPPIATWDSNLTGTFSTAAPARFPYLLGWTELSPGGGKFQFHATSTVEPTVPSRATWSFVTLAGGAIVLGVLGAGALFLGLFLRGGVFRRPPADASRSGSAPSPNSGVPVDPAKSSTAPRRGP